MKIIFNTNQNNTNFCAYNKYFLDTTLKPYVLSNTPIKIIELETGISYGTIVRWIQKRLHTTVKEIYHTQRDKYREEITSQMLTEGKSVKEIADKLNVGAGTVYKLIQNSSLLSELSEKLLQKERAQIAEMLNAGYTIKQISEKMNYSISKTYRSIRPIDINENEQNIEKEKNITKKRFANIQKQRLAESIKDLIEQGFSTKEIAKIRNESKIRIINLIREFNIITPRELAEKKFKEKLPQYFEQNMKLNEMAKLSKVSLYVAHKCIKKMYGKSYQQVKKEFRLKKLQSSNT